VQLYAIARGDHHFALVEKFGEVGAGDLLREGQRRQSEQAYYKQQETKKAVR
jgi:hypothetical protein